MLRANMATPALVIRGRYQITGKPIGQGGMGVVYRAYDAVTKRDVALKTLRGTVSPAELELFSKEWSVLARVSHPNIIDILDSGEFEQEGERKPFFVMPLLPGSTLEQLIANASTRLTVERVVGIAVQTCLGLHAAHEQGLIHRDLKPSNIFVMDDDTVKIIDFGVVHLSGTDSIKSIKGTLQYMAPEQIEMKPASPASDIFSLGVVCYQALTGRKPFARKTESETVDAVRRYIPPPACELNPLVSQIISRVIHKAMAKDPWHRFSTAREYSETLQKAFRGQPIERFDRERIQPRIERAKKAQAEGDHQFASEILSELEAEGNFDPEMRMLRIQLDQAIRQKSIRQLLDSARTRLEEDEFPLALQKIQEVLAIDPDNADALGLRKQIEKQRSERQTQNWLQLAKEHMQNNSFGQARQALEEILKLGATDERAREMLQEVDRREQEVNRMREEKEHLYQSAVNCYQHGEVSSALSKLERVLELNREHPDSATPERDAQYQSFYNQVRSEREAARSSYAEGKRYLADKNFAQALEVCAEFLKKSPGDPMFQALKLEAEEQKRQEQSSFIAEVARRVEAEVDLDRRVSILKDAAERFPDEPHFQQSLRLVRDRRDLVNSIVGKARQYEERGQFNDALSQFDILRNIYAQYPGLEYEAERLKRRRDEMVREEAKGRWVDQIDRHLAGGDYGRAHDLLRTAMAEFPGDRELQGLEGLVRQALQRASEAEQWLQRGQKLCFDRQFGEGLEALRKAASLDNRNAVIRAALLSALVEQARTLLGQDWRAAEPLIEQALNLDNSHPVAKSLQGLVLDYKRQEILNDGVFQVREMQASGDLKGALAKLDEVLALYPNEVRLVQLRKTLQNLGTESGGQSIVAPPETRAEPVQPGRAQGALDTLTVGAGQAAANDSSFTVDRSVTGAPQTTRQAPAVPQPQPSSAPPPTPRRPSTVGAAMSKVQEELHRFSAVVDGWFKPQRILSKPALILIFVAPILLVAALVLAFSRGPAKSPPPPRDYLVEVGSTEPGATYLVDGNPASAPPWHLAPGPHRVERLLAGYKPSQQTFTLSPASPRPVFAFEKTPLPARLQVGTDLKSAKVSLDGQDAVDVQDAGFSSDNVALSTDHTFSLTNAGKAVLSFSFRAEPAALVALSTPMKATDADAVVVSSLGSHARIYSSENTLKAGLKDQMQLIPKEGLDLPEIGANTEIWLDDGKGPLRLPMDMGNAPTLLIRLVNDPSNASLEVKVAVDGVSLSVDGHKPLPLVVGANARSGIPPGHHNLTFIKDGYDSQVVPIDLQRGDTLPVQAPELHLTVKTAFLVIEGATPGAEVLIGGVLRGTVTTDGTLSQIDVQPGDHTITLRKENFVPKDLPRSFTIAQAVHISGVEGQLTPFGILDFKITPAGAGIVYRSGAESQVIDANKRVHVRPGHYFITVTASGYEDWKTEVDVAPDQPLSIEFAMHRTVVAAKPTPTPTPAPISTPEFFVDPASWTSQNGWWAHKGAETWFKSNQGVYVIQFHKPKGSWIKKGRVEWVIDQQDQNNQISYSFDFSTLERKATIDGKPVPAKHKLDPSSISGDTYAVQIDITPERIIIRDGAGQVLDNYPRPHSTVKLGKFGFKGEVELTVKKVE
jgi:eukaryotic-like serine/threonine-protein kinase